MYQQTYDVPFACLSSHFGPYCTNANDDADNEALPARAVHVDRSQGGRASQKKQIAKRMTKQTTADYDKDLRDASNKHHVHCRSADLLACYQCRNQHLNMLVTICFLFHSFIHSFIAGTDCVLYM